MDKKNKSEWNEQVEYSQMYFAETNYCRIAQKNNDFVMWANALQSKMSVAIGVVEAEDKEKIFEWNKEIEKKLNEYKNLLRYKTLGNNISIEAEIKSFSTLKLSLFEIESKLDTLVNEVMPFLNIGHEDDYSDY